MLKIWIKWTYYYEKNWFSHWNARQKKQCVGFVDYDEYIWYILNNMEYSDLERLRLRLFNTYKNQIKYTKFWEEDINWNMFKWYKLESPIIEISSEDFFNLLDSKYKKRYCVWDSFRERYYLKSNFINYVNLNVV